MANENVIGVGTGEGNPESKRAHSEREESCPTSEDMKSTETAVAQEYTGETSESLNEVKKRVRTLRQDGEEYVRENPTKAVFTALGVGFTLGLIFRH